MSRVQAVGDWFRQEHEHLASGLPVMIHPTNRIHPRGVVPVGCRVITKDTPLKLRVAVRACATALAANTSAATLTRCASNSPRASSTGATQLRPPHAPLSPRPGQA